MFWWYSIINNPRRVPHVGQGYNDFAILTLNKLSEKSEE